MNLVEGTVSQVSEDAVWISTSEGKEFWGIWENAPEHVRRGHLLRTVIGEIGGKNHLIRTHNQTTGKYFDPIGSEIPSDGFALINGLRTIGHYGHFGFLMLMIPVLNLLIGTMTLFAATRQMNQGRIHKSSYLWMHILFWVMVIGGFYWYSYFDRGAVGLWLAAYAPSIATIYYFGSANRLTNNNLRKMLVDANQLMGSVGSR